MSELPDSWACATVGDTGQYINGLAFKPSDWKETGTPIIRIQNLTNPSAAINRTDRKVPDLVKVPRGTILVSWSATLDAFIWDREDAVLNQHIFKVVPEERVVTPAFLYQLLRHEIAAMRESAHLHGSTMKHINRGPFLAHEVTLPPLAEQKRIAEKLGATLGRVDACRARLDRVPALLKRFRQSVLAAATTGQLTEDWRENHEVIGEWQATTTGDLFQFVTSGSRGWAAHYSDTGATFLRIGNLNHDDIRLDLREIQRVSPPSGAEGRRTLVRPNDILISITADVGMAGLVPEGIGEAYINQHVALARPIAGSNGRFLAWVLASKPAKDQWKAMQRGATKVGLSLGDIRSIELGVPTLTEQQEIVRRVEALFAYADRIEARLSSAQKTVERLTPAVLAKAFRGHLAPQDPNDEPASALLERIHSQPAAAGPGRRQRKANAMNRIEVTEDAPPPARTAGLVTPIPRPVRAAVPAPLRPTEPVNGNDKASPTPISDPTRTT